jgi:hypothetical protein
MNVFPLAARAGRERGAPVVAPRREIPRCPVRPGRSSTQADTGMASDNDVANALMAKFYSILTAGGGAPPRAFISYVDGGYPFTDADLAFLKEGQLQNYLGQAARFATLANTIPQAAGTWAATGQQVDKMYNTWMSVAQVPEVQLTAAQQKDLAAAQATASKLSAAYQKYETAYQNAVNAVEGLLSMAHKPSDYNVRLEKATQARTRALQQWEALGSKAQYEQAAALANQLSSQGYAGVLQQMQNNYTTAQQQDPDTSAQFVPVLAIPGDFFTSDVSWNTFTFDSSEVSQYESNSRSSWGGGLSGMEDLFVYSVSASGTHTTHSVQIDNSSISVTLEYARVALDRSAWFDSSLLESNAWWYPGATQANPTQGGPLLSDGAPPPNTQGEWQATPQEMVLTRNLLITLDMSSQTNQSAVTTMQAQADVKFLIWPVAQASTSFNSSTNSYTFQKTDQGIYAPQMQMAAFVCSLMPRQPNPQVALLPAA